MQNQVFNPSDFQDQLLRGLTHKMNNILSLFHGYLGMLMDDQTLDGNTLSGLQRIKEGAFCASDLMDRIQALITPNTTALRELDLRDLLTSSIRGFESLQTRGIRIETASEETLPKIMADPGRVRTILSEIVGNAIEASPDNEIVRIQAANSADAFPHSSQSNGIVPWITISVSNTGDDIPPETLKRVFEPFFTTRRKRSAFGLGLPIAQAMVSQLGGNLCFERSENQTVCRVNLPCIPERIE